MVGGGAQENPTHLEVLLGPSAVGEAVLCTARQS